MATYPIKMMIDESGQPFVPLTSLDAVIGEKNLQYILDATEESAGHFKVTLKDVTMNNLINTVIIVRWPDINSTVKPSYLQINNEEEKPLYNGTGTEYLGLEEASNTVNMLAYDGNKWVLTSGAGNSGSGHVITNEAGETMEQQKILNFVGFQVENDGANRLTRIINPEPINNLTTNESGLGSLDAYQGHILSGRSIPEGGTIGQVLAKKNNYDYQVEWIDSLSESNGVITDGSVKKIINLTYEEYRALEDSGEVDPTTQYYINDVSNHDFAIISDDEIQGMIESNTNNTLTSTSTTESLSAAKGKELKEGLDALENSLAATTQLIAEVKATSNVSKLSIDNLNLEPGVYEIIFAEFSNMATSAGHVLRLNGATSGYQGTHMHPIQLKANDTAGQWRFAYHNNGLAYVNGWSMGAQLNYGTYTLHYFNKDWITATGQTYMTPSPDEVTEGGKDGEWNILLEQGSYNGHQTDRITSISIESLDTTLIGKDSYIKLYRK